jgi:hypothetical protein
MGALTNIDREGFASAAFHSFPETLAWDPYSGDYGPNFFGHALNTGVYVIDHPEFGRLAFGGELEDEAGIIRVRPRDAFRRRVYVAPLGLWLTLDAGRFRDVEIDVPGRVVRLGLEPADPYTPAARLRIQQPAEIGGVGRFLPRSDLKMERGAFVIELGPAETRITLDDRR